MQARIADAFLNKFQLKQNEIKALRGSKDGIITEVSLNSRCPYFRTFSTSRVRTEYEDSLRAYANVNLSKPLLAVSLQYSLHADQNLLQRLR